MSATEKLDSILEGLDEARKPRQPRTRLTMKQDMLRSIQNAIYQLEIAERRLKDKADGAVAVIDKHYQIHDLAGDINVESMTLADKLR